MLFKKIVLIALGATVVNAHMKMIHPVPYGKASLNNSPLNAKGEDFPCKLRDDTYEVSTENMMEPGVPQTLQLAGQATHGGGSCQISLTEDRAPTKDTVWKVIQSWEGGCPANVTGNMGGDANALDPETFTFKIPHDIAAGKYTLAWTWFNRVGNREMYMNCAPVTVTGGASKREVSTVEKRATSYPPMFVANVNGCTTKEGVDIRFPQPGADPLQLGAVANLAPAGQPACEGTPKFAGAGITGSGTSSSGSSGSFGGSPVSIPSASPTTMASVAPTGAPSQSSTTYVPVPGAPVGTGLPPVPKPVTASAAAPSSSSPASSGAPTNPCSPDGVWNCIGGTSFQRCDHGKWTPPQQMAAGTQCTPGQSADLSISTVKIARRVPGMHLRKRAHGKSRHI